MRKKAQDLTIAIFIDPKNSSEEGAVLARYEENALFLWRV